MDTAPLTNEQLNVICTKLDGKDPASPLDYTGSYGTIIWLVKKQPLKVQEDVMAKVNDCFYRNGTICHPRAWAGALVTSLIKHNMLQL